MIRFWLISLFLIPGLYAFSQDPVTKPFDFKGHFAKAIENDTVNNIFLVDMTRLPSRFERVYFMNLSFSVPELVNVGVEIEGEMAVFTANKKYSVALILKSLEELKEKVVTISAAWSAEKKADWLKENDKYK